MKNEYRVMGDTTAIYLNAKGTILTAYIDTSMLPKLSQVDKTLTCLHSHGKLYVGYREGKPKRRWVHLHRLLTSCPEGMVVDHEDGDTFNNRMSNLKVCSQYENTCNRKDNTSGIPGVSWYESKGKWHAKVWVAKKQVHIGYYDCKYQAGRAITRYRVSNNMVVLRKPIKVKNLQEAD